MLRCYPEAGFDRWVCENQPGPNAQFAKGWWDTVEWIRFLQSEFPISSVTVVGDFDMTTPPPSEILQMPIFLLHLPGLDVCLKNDFSFLEPYWTASVLIRDDRPLSAYGLLAPFNRWQRDMRDTIPPEWQFPEYSPGSRRFSCALAHDQGLYAFMWLLTHLSNSTYTDKWDAYQTESRPD
jgi:hypothetical protein